MSMARTPQVVVVPLELIEATLAETRPLLRPGAQLVYQQLADTVIATTTLLQQQNATIARLRRFLGITSSEKTADVCGHRGAAEQCLAPGAALAEPGPAPGAALAEPGPAPGAALAEPGAAPGAALAETEPSAPGAAEQAPPAAAKQRKAKGHGRVPASAYPDAQCVPVLHESLRPGDTCLLCGRGRLYELSSPAQILRIVGQPPLVAVCWNCQRLRCSGCGHVFTATAPAAAQGPKYDETAVSMMALMRYRAGLPLHRLEQLERHLATPVPASTQWDAVNARVGDVRPVFEELCRQAAQGQIVHNDDSYARILAFMGKRRAALLAQGALPDPERTGIFTTAIVSIVGEQPIALFCTGRQHAGENLSALLAQRAAGLAAPLLMSDALDRNVPKGHAVDEANCLAHGRRHVVDEVASFPGECAHILLLLGKVFRVDHLCRHHGLSPDKRLLVHQRWSGPVMAQLHEWMTAQFAEKRIEPNSGLGRAMNYLLKRWDKLTRFLSVPAAPLENNICERALKMAIRHRNNSLFYKSQHGANVGDVYMTLIYTAELHRQNPFDYLTALQRHARAVAERPAEWLPWSYRETLDRLAPPDVRARDPSVPAAPPVPTRPSRRGPIPAMPSAHAPHVAQLSL
jgi:transposase